MSKLAGLASGPVLGAGALVAVVAGVGLYAAGVFTPEDVAQDPAANDAVTLLQPVEETPLDAAEPAPENNEPSETVVEETATEQNAQAETATAALLPAAPSIDTFRLDPDGSMLVAGQSRPGWSTTVLVDDAELETVTSDGSGKFVAFLSLAPSDQPRILSLMMRSEDGATEVASVDEIIIAPTPVVAAEIEAETAPEAEAETALEAEAEPEAETAPLDVAQADAAPEDKAVAEQSDEAAPDVAATTEPVQAADTPEPAAVTEDLAATSQTVLLANEEGVQVIQPAVPVDVAPEVMSTVALDAISYSEQGEVQLSGRGQGEGFVRVYLDNAPVTTLQIAEDGNWRGDLPEVDTGVYTLRIDETDAEGNVTSRVETPFKREDEALISQAQEAVEQQRITAVTVQPGSTLWAISRERYGEGTLYVRVFEANKDRIRNPDLIYPGQVFSLPE